MHVNLHEQNLLFQTFRVIDEVTAVAIILKMPVIVTSRVNPTANPAIFASLSCSTVSDRFSPNIEARGK